MILVNPNPTVRLPRTTRVGVVYLVFGGRVNANTMMTMTKPQLYIVYVRARAFSCRFDRRATCVTVDACCASVTMWMRLFYEAVRGGVGEACWYYKEYTNIPIWFTATGPLRFGIGLVSAYMYVVVVRSA